MTIPYGYAKGTLIGPPELTSKRLEREIQYHEHFKLDLGREPWDIAVNVGTDQADDLLRYRLVFDFHHSILSDLTSAPRGAKTLTGMTKLPALDFVRSDILANTDPWRDSDPMDGSDVLEPVASLKRLLTAAHENNWDVCVFGRFYGEGAGMHDIHMNQGSLGRRFAHRPDDDSEDHNEIWQDGALFVNRAAQGWAAYFAMFTQQSMATDNLGNPH
jgi:uncharacterized protein YukJ